MKASQILSSLVNMIYTGGIQLSMYNEASRQGVFARREKVVHESGVDRSEVKTYTVDFSNMSSEQRECMIFDPYYVGADRKFI